jgi:hypothetical protein
LKGIEPSLVAASRSHHETLLRESPREGEICAASGVYSASASTGCIKP